MIINYGGSGTYSEDGKGGYIWRRNTQDGHGGHSLQHRQEMELIADAVVQKRMNEALPEIKRAAVEQAYSDLLQALSFDVTSAVNIGFKNGESIFKDKKTQKIVADAVMREVYKQLKRMK